MRLEALGWTADGFSIAGRGRAGWAERCRQVDARQIVPRRHAQPADLCHAYTIAQGLAGFNPDSAAIEASRIMLERLHALADQRADFAFETTLAARSYAAWLRRLRRSGYTVQLTYLWLRTADLAVARVA